MEGLYGQGGRQVFTAYMCSITGKENPKYPGTKVTWVD